jgi:hypothetical protein
MLCHHWRLPDDGENYKKTNSEKQLPHNNNKIATAYWRSWFCFGGWIANMMAV